MSNVLKAINQWAKQQPDSLAIKSNLQSLCYADFVKEINQLNDVLVAYQGQVLAIDIGNSPAWVVSDLGCIQNGVCSVPIPAFFTASQREHALSSSGAVAILNDQQIGDEIAVCGTQKLYLQPLVNEASKPKLPKFLKLPKQTAKVTYTSGSTGEPKGVCLPLAAMEQVAESLVEVLGNEVGASTAAILPLPVLLENIAGCYATLLSGGCYNIHTADLTGFTQPFKPDFKQLIEYLQDIEASSCILVPELLRGLMQALVVTQSSLPSLKYIAVGGSKVSDKLLMQAQALGLPVYQGYGLSEAASVIAINKPDHNNLISVGQLLPHVELSSSDDGELIISNPAFLGYVGDEGCTEGSTENDTTDFATGDLGEIDEEGFIYLNGRKKNLLITSQGRNVSPEWPESELLTQPSIMQTMVVGDGQAHLSALVVPSSPDFDEAVISNAIDQANQHLPEYAHIKQFIVVPPFTMGNQQLTGTGRVRRNIIMQNYQSQIQQLYSNKSNTGED